MSPAAAAGQFTGPDDGQAGQDLFAGFLYLTIRLNAHCVPPDARNSWAPG